MTFHDPSGCLVARLSIPRDVAVDIPGHGRNKINAAYAFGGPALTIKTLKQYLGIDINAEAAAETRRLILEEGGSCCAMTGAPNSSAAAMMP